MQAQTLPTLGNRDTIRQNSQRGFEVVKIELSKVVVREGFNKREDYGDIEGLAESILQNGQAVPCRVDVLADGTFCLTDGHRRHKALQLLAQRGHEPFMFAIVNNSKTTEEQRILQMFTTQDSKPLEPHEVAELFKELINLGYKAVDIARKVGKSSTYVGMMLDFANEAPAIKEEVRKGNLKVSTAIKLKKSIPDTSKRINAVKEAVEESAPKGELPEIPAPPKKVTAEKVEMKAGLNKKREKAEEMTIAILDFMDIAQFEQREGLTNLILKFI